MHKTEINDEKLKAFKATDYRICSPDMVIILKIGEPSLQLLELFKKSNENCGAFITAYNPYGTLQSDNKNKEGHKKLASLFKDLKLKIIEGYGSEANTDWPSELSYFALGLRLDEAMQTGNAFNQDAILWVDSDSLPQLILLR